MSRPFKITRVQSQVDRLGELKEQIRELTQEANLIEEKLQTKVGTRCMGLNFTCNVFERRGKKLSLRKISRFIGEKDLASCYVKTKTATVVSVKRIEEE